MSVCLSPGVTAQSSRDLPVQPGRIRSTVDVTWRRVVLLRTPERRGRLRSTRARSEKAYLECINDLLYFLKWDGLTIQKWVMGWGGF